MPQRDEAWLRLQQMRWLRPDGDRWVRLDAVRLLAPGSDRQGRCSNSSNR